MAKDLEEELQEVEASWPQTKELAYAMDDPMEKLVQKAQAIFKGKHWDTLDALACRIASAIPAGVTEKNFDVAEPIAGAAKKYFSNVEKLREGLKRPFLDAGKAVDNAAKATVARAEPTLKPIIDAVKKIADRRKKEEADREAAEQKRIADEAAAKLKAEQDAERARIKAEQDAENARLAAIAEANRVEAARIAAEKKALADEAAKHKSVNDELQELKRKLAERTTVCVPKASAEEVKRAMREAPDMKMVELPPFDFDNPTMTDDQATWPVEGSAKFNAAQLQLIMLDADASAEYSKAGVVVHEACDQQKVRDFGMAIKAFIDGLKRPLLVKHEARQAVELAVFDMYGIANSLQEWGMP